MLNKIRFLYIKTPWLLLVLIILSGAFLRFYHIGRESFWLDEIIMLHVAGGGFHNIYNEALIGRPPVYVILAHLWLNLFGTSETAARALSALFGTVSIIAMYLVAKQLFGKRAGIISALLISISYIQIYHSQEFRYYSLLTFFTLLSYYFFIRLINKKSIRCCISYVIVTALVFYSHTFGFFVIVAQNIYLLLQPRLLRRLFKTLITCQLFIFALIAPGLYFAVFKTLDRYGGAEWLGYPRTDIPFETLILYVLLPINLSKYWKLALIPPAAYLIFKAILIDKGKTLWIEAITRTSDEFKYLKQNSSLILMILLWLIIPVLLPFSLSFIIGPMYIYRYTIAASPALLILIALVIVAIRHVIPEYLVVLSLIIISIPGLNFYYNVDTKEQWREAASYVERESVDKDAILIVDTEENWVSKSFNWYFKGEVTG